MIVKIFAHASLHHHFGTHTVAVRDANGWMCLVAGKASPQVKHPLEMRQNYLEYFKRIQRSPFFVWLTTLCFIFFFANVSKCARFGLTVGYWKMHGSVLLRNTSQFLFTEKKQQLHFLRSLSCFFSMFFKQKSVRLYKSRVFDGANAFTPIYTFEHESKFKFSWKCAYTQGQNHQIKPLNSFLFSGIFSHFFYRSNLSHATHNTMSMFSFSKETNRWENKTKIDGRNISFLDF